jgi:hypothetical protein
MAKEFCTISPGPNGWVAMFPGGLTRACGSEKEAKAIAIAVNSWIGFKAVIDKPETTLELNYLREWHRRLAGYGVELYAAEIKAVLEEAEGRIREDDEDVAKES